MWDVIAQTLGQFGIAVGQEAVKSITRLIQVEGDLLLARGALKLAESTGMEEGETKKREGTVQVLEHERTLRREDLIRCIPIATQDQVSGLVGWAISHAVLLARSIPEED